MAKIGEQARRRYFDIIKEYKAAATAIVEEERKTAAGLHKGDLSQTPVRLMLANKNLSLVSYYSLMNSLSCALLGVKNEGFLNEARKACYKAIIYLEAVVSNCMDCPFADYEAGVEAVDAALGDREKYDLIRKLGFSIDTVKDGYGANSKWKWSFVELEGRFAVVVKNLINFKTLLPKMDPAHKSYDAVLRHVGLAQRSLAASADAYREKYELSTRRADDMELAIGFLSALRRVHILLGEGEKAEVIKRKVDVWRTKLATDEKEREKKVDQAGPGRPDARARQS